MVFILFRKICDSSARFAQNYSVNSVAFMAFLKREGREEVWPIAASH